MAEVLDEGTFLHEEGVLKSIDSRDVLRDDWKELYFTSRQEVIGSEKPSVL